ncbi:NAD-dependent epimerase/dehydratase family protein [Verrucomicrobiaceae bacterium 5K15]|uniref:NAD-dependent epimerase/dehydratase family protein n=1 Tax=Oceaniferula flava TaxID=2800421 RepID=A0AAE2V8U6_9BACT|nr:NAD-dependent epimerase/dehydratase family protein [Oceaniferula flavus]MBK1856047.1 NAD-dependent epimerase/dehydratase family protein [Oceaniferula flavus]MBM1137354.1 NAD-dependent epimerase/dehydratase family protein [Oceaniferula flavus]
MKILVTGGAGFIGSHIVEHFQGKAEEIRVLDNLRTGYRENLHGLDHTFIEGSITDRALVKQAVEGVDYIFHMAAMVSVPESMAKISECVEINVNGLLNVLEEASAAKVKKLVFASSAANYGDNPTVPKVETMYPEPKSPYAITKLDGEYYLEMFRTEGLLETTSVRFFNVFGPRQDPKGAYAAAVPIFIEKAVKGENITVFGDGEQTRDFIYVKDIVGALVFAATTEGVHGTYNAGYGGQITINDLANNILASAGTDSKLVHGPERAGDVKHSRASSEKLRAAGWQPQHTLEEGLAATFEFFRNKLGA